MPHSTSSIIIVAALLSIGALTAAAISDETDEGIISTPKLEELLEESSSGKKVVLIDTRLGDDFAEVHIPTARNYCVFESASLAKLMEDFGPEKETTTFVTYSADDSCYGSRHARDRLLRRGFKNVLDYRGGLAEWIANDKDVMRDDEKKVQPVPAIPDGTRPADLKETRVQWTGRNLLNKHEGSLGVKSAQLTFEHGQLTGGEFIIDMNDIKCFDLAGGDYHDYLIGHLKNEDFFDVENYPEASFKIEHTSEIPAATPGSPNLHVSGYLTIKGKTQHILFDATVGTVPESGLFACQATFTFDRTLHDVLYGSGKLFSRLAGHVVNDNIEMAIRLVEAKRD